MGLREAELSFTEFIEALLRVAWDSLGADHGHHGGQQRPGSSGGGGGGGGGAAPAERGSCKGLCAASSSGGGGGGAASGSSRALGSAGAGAGGPPGGPARQTSMRLGPSVPTAETEVTVDALRDCVAGLVGMLGEGWAGKHNRWELDVAKQKDVARIRELFRKATAEVAEEALRANAGSPVP